MLRTVEVEYYETEKIKENEIGKYQSYLWWDHFFLYLLPFQHKSRSTSVEYPFECKEYRDRFPFQQAFLLNL